MNDEDRQERWDRLCEWLLSPLPSFYPEIIEIQFPGKVAPFDPD